MRIVISEVSPELARTWQLVFRDVRLATVMRCTSADFLRVANPDCMVAYMVDMNARYGDGAITEYARVLPVHVPDAQLPPQVVTVPGRLWLKLLGNTGTRQPDQAPLPIAQQYAYEALKSIFVALRDHNLASERPIRVFGIDGDQLRANFRYGGPGDYLIGAARLAYENVFVYAVEGR